MLLSRPLACSAAMIRQSIASSSHFGISAHPRWPLRHTNAPRTRRIAQFGRTCLSFLCDGFKQPSGEPVMDHENLTTLMTAVARYFDLMHEADVSTFDSIFRPTAQLHGLRNGQMRMLSASEYKALIAAGPSPKSKGAPR